MGAGEAAHTLTAPHAALRRCRLPQPQPKQFRHPHDIGVAARGSKLQNMLRRALASAVGGGARYFSSKSYPIVDHTFDAIVVGAGKSFMVP